jgi:hypothetical protein
MQISAPIRLVTAICLSACVLQAQSRKSSRPKPSALAPSTLPATPPPAPPPPPAPLTPAQSPANRAAITYTGNLLTLSASNSSLNQILREISRLTGIKISGGVTDERVFGTYGPDAPSNILATLLDGTGSNMLLLQGTDASTAELILTPRLGGPTPPNPNAAPSDEDSDSSEPAPPNPVAQPIQNQPAGPSAPSEIPPRARYTPDQRNGLPPSNPAAPADQGPQQSPNGVKTPQQIYDELQRLRQQQQQQQTNPQ